MARSLREVGLMGVYANVWEVAVASETHLSEMLAEGWEPFAVTHGARGYYVFHLRRRTGRRVRVGDQP